MNNTKNLESFTNSQNILEIIDTKLQLFRRKKLLLQQSIDTDKQESQQIEHNINELQIKIKSIAENIQKNENQLVELDKIIENIDEGYKNIIQSGETLMALVELPNE